MLIKLSWVISKDASLFFFVLPCFSQILQYVFIIYFDLLAVLLYCHFNIVINHSITFPVSQHTMDGLLTQPISDYLLRFCIHPLFTANIFNSRFEPMISLQTLSSPLSFPDMTLPHWMSCHKMCCQIITVYIHFGTSRLQTIAHI